MSENSRDCGGEAVGNKIARPAVSTEGSVRAEATLLPDESKAVDFDRTFLPHMDAAYNLARWLVRDDHDAQDVVQEAYLRAFRFVGGFRGGDPRAWILAIVRNTAFTWLKPGATFRVNRTLAPNKCGGLNICNSITSS